MIYVRRVDILNYCSLNINLPIKDVHRRQKLTTDFFKLFELTILVVNISISRQNMLTVVSRGSFLRGLIKKS